jgi:hypothetical protein
MQPLTLASVFTKGNEMERSTRNGSGRLIQRGLWVVEFRYAGTPTWIAGDDARTRTIVDVIGEAARFADQLEAEEVAREFNGQAVEV